MISAALAGFVAWRMTQRAPVPPAAREGAINLPATTPRLADIDPGCRGGPRHDDGRSGERSHRLCVTSQWHRST